MSDKHIIPTLPYTSYPEDVILFSSFHPERWYSTVPIYLANKSTEDPGRVRRPRERSERLWVVWKFVLVLVGWLVGWLVTIILPYIRKRRVGKGRMEGIGKEEKKERKGR